MDSRVQQRRGGSARQVDGRGRESAVDEPPAPVTEDGAAIMLAVGREEPHELLAGVKWATSSPTQRRYELRVRVASAWRSSQRS
jgi:hypothetical protein